MRTELPKKWTIKASNKKEAKLLAPYATKIALDSRYKEWTINDCLEYYLKVENGGYEGGNKTLSHSFELITFEEFKSLVLGEKQQIEPIYEVY